MRYMWLGGLVMGLLPMTASARHIDFGVSVGLPVPFIGVGYHNHYIYPRGYCYAPRFYGGYYGPTYIGATTYCAPTVVYSAPPSVVYTTPPVQYYAPAPVYSGPPVQQYAPVPQPAPQYQPAPYYSR